MDSFGNDREEYSGVRRCDRELAGYTQFSGEASDKATSDMIINIFDLGMSVEDATNSSLRLAMQPDLVNGVVTSSPHPISHLALAGGSGQDPSRH